MTNNLTPSTHKTDKHQRMSIDFSLCTIGEMIEKKDDDDDDDSDSDNEDDDDVTDNHITSNETKPKDEKYEGFFERFFENLVEKLSVLRTRAGRAGLVHNFLRGLQVLTAPFLSGLLLSVNNFPALFSMNAYIINVC